MPAINEPVRNFNADNGASSASQAIERNQNGSETSSIETTHRPSSTSHSLRKSRFSDELDTTRVSLDSTQRPRDPKAATVINVGKPMVANPTLLAVKNSSKAVPTFAESRRTFGLNDAGFAKFQADTGAFYAKSASADAQLNNLNDHDGVLVVAARDGVDSVAERFAVVKDNGHFYIKAQGDRAINFADFQAAVLRLNSYTPQQAEARRAELKGEIQKALGCEPREVPMQETLLRSEMLALALTSQLTFRRDTKESDDKLMPLPPNPTEFPKGASWANSENALCPGAGPVLRNGTRLYQLDWNMVENRLMGFKNNNGDVPRQDSTMSSHVPGHKAPVLVGGPVLFELGGIKSWQLIGPADEQPGVKGGKVQRAAKAAKNLVTKDKVLEAGDAAEMPTAMAKLKPGAHIRITTEDNVVHDLKLTDKGMSLSLGTATAGHFGGDETGAYGVGMDVEAVQAESYTRHVQADVNVYSHQGRNTGKHGSSSGLPDPELVLSTGEALKAGPLLNTGGVFASVVDAMGRLMLYQPALGGEGRGGWARLANTGIRAGGKFATTALSAKADKAMRGPGGTHIKDAMAFSGVGAGNASTGAVAGSAALIVAAQEGVNLIKDAVLPVIPENVKKPDNIYARNLVNFTCGWVEEMARLEINLGVQWAMGLRAGTPVDHATLAVSSGLKAGLDVVKDNIGDREVQPYAHMAIDAVQAMQYMLARVTGMVLSEEKASKLGRGKDFEEALRTRVNLRLYDQVLAPAFTYILNANGLLGENPSAFDNQVARERMVQHLGAKLMQGLMASWGGDHGPLGEMITDKNLLATLRANMDHLLVGGRDPKDTEFYSGTDLAREKVKHKLNRASLAATDGQAFYQMLSATFQQLTDKLRPPEPQDLEAGNPDHRVGRAIEMQSLEDPTREGLRQRRGEKVRALVTAQDERIAGARAYTSGRSDLNAGESSPTTNSITEASRAQREVVAKQERQLMGKHNNLPTDAEGALDLSRTPQGPLRSAVPQPVQIDYALRQRDAAGKRDTRGVNADLRRTDTHRAGVPVDQISRDVGTFSGKLQAGALREHLPMTRAAGMPEVVKKSRTKDSFLGRITNLVRRAAAPVLPSPIRPLNNDMKDRIDNSVRDYTVESQFFHYPLRWPVTGQPMVMKLAKKEIAPGVELAYNVLNKPGNIKGEKSKRVDPIEALYANIGCARAKKFPADLLRAVVTEAAYKNLDPANPQEADGVLQTGGSLGVMSEIFSASASAKVAAQFNLPISGFGAVHKSNSQRIDLVQETGVNIAAMTDLAQAEVILMPGAMFRVKHVDENAGKRPAAAGTTGVPPRDIGQVVYAESIDTYKMEQDYEAAVAYLGGAGGKAPAVGTLTVEPDTGQVLRFVRTPDKGDKVYDPATKTFSDHDSSKPMPNGALVFDSKTKNYFLGRPLEFANLAEQEALWRHPYAGRSAKRATKDAIHAAIVRGDPIVEHLDEAIKNLHHEHYRREGGFYDTVDDGHGTQVYSNPRAQAEADRTARTKEAAKAVAADHLSSGGFSQPLDDVGTEMLAWTTASYLRTPVKLMPVHGQTGLPAEGLSINETYDKVDMLKDPLKRKPPPAVTIGVGPDGYYAMRKVNDRFEPTHKITGQTEGKSAENFMQAFLRAGPLDKFHFNEQPPSEPGGTPTYKADSFAKHSASQLYGKLCGFAKTDYIVLQQALVERQERATARAGGTGTPPQQRKGSTSSTGSRESAAAGTSKGRYVPPPEASFDQWLEAEQAAKERVDASESEEDEIQFVIDHEPDPTGPNKGKSKA